ncbi:peptidoglycan DD-metalloendopeptidase family protein [Nisaea acidiphila]|uniref:Peptidoglycan DD-metalloendopeptidase family protein n=1 Tax=Nisaea acidiphila TaxID=1862145 RepID=A0A9J7AYC0_9PROT|nr:M23 family metallopeptidase [Nisaea acidiphila]UUX50429.1 peptidoglycan DD-metalloendopeptidase family protein [Nisaea acidiphila]
METRSTSLASTITAWIGHIFREREVILRSDSRIRYFTLSTRFQLGVVAAWMMLAGWLGFASVGVYMQDELLQGKDVAIQRSQDSYRQLLDQVSDYQLSVVAITRDLKETQAQLQRLFDQNEGLRSDLTSTESRLKYTQVERDRINAGRKALNDQFSLLGRELRRMTAKNNGLETHISNLRTHLVTLEAEKNEIAAEREKLDGRLWRLNNELAESEAQREQLTDTIARMRSDLRTVMLERSSGASENDALRARISSLEARLADIDSEHQRRLELISDRALNNIHAVEAVLRRTGLDLERIAPMPEGMIMGQGGPFIPYHPELQPERSEADSPEAQLELRLSRWEQLRDVYLSVPLIAPMKDYYFTSGFGRRKDPINGRWAMHAGLDMSGPRKQEVMSAAPGKVIRAQRERFYGRIVEIDHGNNITTRYAHLSKIEVKVGQEIGLGEVIGRMGNSGRSTAPHLHYEVRYKNRPLNPRNFLKAGRYVFKKG